MLIRPICFSCKNFKGSKNGELACKAFDVIPDDILFGRKKHFKPLPNQQNSVVFEPNINSA